MIKQITKTLLPPKGETLFENGKPCGVRVEIPSTRSETEFENVDQVIENIFYIADEGKVFKNSNGEEQFAVLESELKEYEEVEKGLVELVE